MSVLDNYPTASARDAAYPAATNIGRCIFRTDTKAIEVSDGSNYLSYNYDSLSNLSALTNTYSVDLDGSNDYIDLGTNTYFDTATALTVSGWVTLDVFTSYPIFCSFKTNTTTGWKIGFSQQGDYNTVFMGSNSNFANLRGGSTQLQTDLVTDFQHIAVTYNGNGAGTGGNYKLYVNGSQQTLSSAGAFAATGNVSYIGRDSGGNYLNGKIDEFSVFTSELNSQQIGLIYNNGVGGVDIGPLNPLAWWRMGDNDSGTGTTITDQGSGGNNGTLTNGPTFSTSVPS